MLKRVVLALSILASTAALTPQAWAIDRCPPLRVAANDICECAVQNYGSGIDTDVTITLHDGIGPEKICGPFNISPGGSNRCTLGFMFSFNCGCQVTGEGAASRTSLSTADFDGATSHASVNCN